jgi:MFS family permease
VLSRPVAFWALGGLLGLVLFAAAAPSPLYVVYQARWHFSALVLTLVFAVYVLALLATLVCAGSLSDRVGRRPVLLVALGVLAAGMAVFGAARSVGWLLAGRALQGAATGLATSALSAALIDLQPPDRPRLGALVSSAAPLLGLAAGALGTGLLVQYGPDPLRLVFFLLLGAYAASGVLVARLIPETRAGGSGWARPLRVELGVPPHARRPFAAVAPAMIATWALGGLYLSLGPSLAVSLLHTTSHVTGGLVIVALMATGALASVLARDSSAERLMLGGAGVLVIGVGLTLAALHLESTWLFFAGSAVAGAGFGPAFAGAFRTVTALAGPTERGGLVAAIYTVSYSAFSLPAIAAGVAVSHVGLPDTTDVYAVAVMVLAVAAIAATAAQLRQGRMGPAPS